MVPKFFRNAKEIYKKNAANKEVTHTNKNPNKKRISDKVKKILEDEFSREIEFYEFCVQRLERQFENVRYVYTIIRSCSARGSLLTTLARG
jgi:hypothetical protein